MENLIKYLAFSAFILGDDTGDQPVSVRETSYLQKDKDDTFMITIELTNGAEDVGFYFRNGVLDLIQNGRVMTVYGSKFMKVREWLIEHAYKSEY